MKIHDLAETVAGRRGPATWAETSALYDLLPQSDRIGRGKLQTLVRQAQGNDKALVELQQFIKLRQPPTLAEGTKLDVKAWYSALTKALDVAGRRNLNPHPEVIFGQYEETIGHKKAIQLEKLAIKAQENDEALRELASQFYRIHTGDEAPKMPKVEELGPWAKHIGQGLDLAKMKPLEALAWLAENYPDLEIEARTELQNLIRLARDDSHAALKALCIALHNLSRAEEPVQVTKGYFE